MKIIYINENVVSIERDNYGVKAYINSQSGRLELQKECLLEILKEVVGIWGEFPTVIDDHMAK